MPFKNLSIPAGYLTLRLTHRPCRGISSAGFSLCGFDVCSIAKKAHRLKPALPNPLGEEIEDFLIPFERRNQVRAGNSGTARGARPVEQPARQGESMIARGGTRGFQLLQ